MEKVKDIMTVLKKHHFWLLSGAVALAILISWYSTTGTLATEAEANQSQIETKFGDMTRIANSPLHPTSAFADAVEKLQIALRDMTFAAWEKLYQAQKPRFKWPAVLPDFQNLKETDPITREMRGDYMNYVRTQFPDLFDLVQVRQEVLPEGTTGLGDYRPRSQDAGAMVHYTGVVDWDPIQRDALQLKYRWPTVPTELQVRLANEDISVYRALLSIIRETNDLVDATDNRNAAIKRINYLDIAAAFWTPQPSDAGQTMILPPVTAGATPGASAYPVTEEKTNLAESPYGPEATAGSMDEMRMTNRYLDEQWKPVDGKAALENPPFAEFKQMPIRMGLTVDQRRIPMLLAACANSPLTVEVRQVRYNPGNPEAGVIVQQVMAKAQRTNMVMENSFSRGYGDEGRSNRPTRSIMPPRTQTYTSPYSRYGARGGMMDELAGPNDMDIEIRGIVYIYNYPDRAKLGTGTATDASQRKAAGFPQIPGGGGSGGSYFRGSRGDTDS